MIQIPKAQLRRDPDDELSSVTTFSGVIRFDQDKDRDEVYGNCESVLDVFKAIDEKGRGLYLVYDDGNSTQSKRLMIRDANLRSRLIWAHVLP